LWADLYWGLESAPVLALSLLLRLSSLLPLSQALMKLAQLVLSIEQFR
jgi:hypothetical protein